MAKSTLVSLEKLLEKFISPIEQKFAMVIKELKKLEDKIDKLESKNQLTTKNAGSGNNTPTVCDLKKVTHTPTAGHQQYTREAKRLTHTDTPPSTVTTQPCAPAPAPPAPLPLPPSASLRQAAQLATPLCRPPPQKPNAPSQTRQGIIDDDTSDGWNVVKHNKTKRHINRRSVITGKGSVDNELQIVERVRKIHACFFKPDTTPECIISYMHKKNPGTGYNADKLKLAHNYYSSFAITVPSSKFDFFMSGENRPVGTEISEWYRHSDGRARGASTQGPEPWLRRKPSSSAPPQCPTTAASSGPAERAH